MTEEKREQILDAAFESFIRYGFKRTTMGDIATRAEVSRPLVYQAFVNKEDIFVAGLRRYCDEARKRSEMRAKEAPDLRRKLSAVVWVWSGETCELLNQGPEAREVYACTFGFASEIRDFAVRTFFDQLVAVIRNSPEVDLEALAERGHSPEFFAEFIATCSDGVEQNAKNQAEAELYLNTLIDGVVLMIRHGSPAELTPASQLA